MIWGLGVGIEELFWIGILGGVRFGLLFDWKVKVGLGWTLVEHFLSLNLGCGKFGYFDFYCGNSLKLEKS